MHVSLYLGLLLFVSSLVAHRSSSLLSDDPSTSDVGSVPVRVQRGRGGDYLMSAIIVSERAMGHGERNGGDGGRWGKDCRIAHGDEGEGVILIRPSFVSSTDLGRGWRRVMSVWRGDIVRWFIGVFRLRHRTVCLIVRFRRSEFEI